MSKKYALVVMVTAMLSGCASIGKKQIECEQRNSKFADIVSCTKVAFADNSRAMSDPGVRMYFARGDQLVEKLNAGEISEVDAKAEWQQMYIKLRNDQNEASARNTPVNTYNAPVWTNCTTYGSNTSCTSR